MTREEVAALVAEGQLVRKDVERQVASMRGPQPPLCPECLRLRSAIARALVVIRRMAGGALHEVRVLLEEAIR